MDSRPVCASCGKVEAPTVKLPNCGVCGGNAKSCLYFAAATRRDAGSEGRLSLDAEDNEGGRGAMLRYLVGCSTAALIAGCSAGRLVEGSSAALLEGCSGAALLARRSAGRLVELLTPTLLAVCSGAVLLMGRSDAAALPAQYCCCGCWGRWLYEGRYESPRRGV